MVPVPEAVQGLAVLVSERQDLSHGLAGRRQAVLRALLRPSGLTGRPHPETGPTPRRHPEKALPGATALGRQGFAAPEGLRAFKGPRRVTSFFFCQEGKYLS